MPVTYSLKLPVKWKFACISWYWPRKKAGKQQLQLAFEVFPLPCPMIWGRYSKMLGISPTLVVGRWLKQGKKFLEYLASKAIKVVGLMPQISLKVRWLPDKRRHSCLSLANWLLLRRPVKKQSKHEYCLLKGGVTVSVQVVSRSPWIWVYRILSTRVFIKMSLSQLCVRQNGWCLQCQSRMSIEIVASKSMWFTRRRRCFFKNQAFICHRVLHTLTRLKMSFAQMENARTRERL